MEVSGKTYTSFVKKLSGFNVSIIESSLESLLTYLIRLGLIY
jgi:hypothetical protein